MEYREWIHECSRLIAAKGLTIAFAESASAGKLAFEFSQTEFSGRILKGGVVCYHVCIKETVLGIPAAMIEEYTPESPEVTRAMAERLRKMVDAGITVAITGLTTPGGSEHPGKPVGTMFYCVLIGKQVLERKKIFSGTPGQIIDLTIEQVAKTIVKALEG